MQQASNPNQIVDLFDKVKKCTKCKQVLPLTNFGKRKVSTDGYNWTCKDCYNAKQREFREKNPELHQQYRRQSNLRHHYGISMLDYNLQLERQNHRSAICEKHQSEFQSALVVDHSHDTGKIRALLCGNCNLGLGNFQDDSNVLQKAIEYLHIHKERRREGKRLEQERTDELR